MQVAYAIFKIFQVLIFFHHKINFEYIFYFSEQKNYIFALIFFNAKKIQQSLQLPT
jgi:hypothetical protein